MNFPRLLLTFVCAASFAAGPVRAGLFAPSGVDNPNVPRVPPATKAAPTGEILATPPEVVNGYVKLSFARLSAFKFTPPEYDPVATPDAPPPSVDGQIPETIRKFDGQKAVVTGFMVPTHMEGAVVTEFMLVSSPSLCCYGIVPNMNEWVVVKMPAGAGVPPLMDVPVAVSGKLHVHGQFENGYLTGIYQLDAERVEPVKP
jgi:hypothetical protein